MHTLSIIHRQSYSCTFVVLFLALSRFVQMGMDEMMKQLMKDSDEEFRTQVEYILEQLQKENTEPEEVSDGTFGETRS
jgi:hypothetical protein